MPNGRRSNVNRLHVFADVEENVGDLRGYAGFQTARKIAELVIENNLFFVTLAMVEDSGELTALAQMGDEGEFFMVNPMSYEQYDIIQDINERLREAR